MVSPPLQVGPAMSATAISASLLIGAGFFALGYLLARHMFSPRDNDEKFKTRSFWSRLLFWSHKSATEKKVDGERDSIKNKEKKKPLLEIENLAEIIEDFKMVLVVRNDLKMGKGKIAAQCSHATLGLYKKLLNRAPKSLNRWEMCGQVKVVVKIETEEEMLVLQERAKSLSIPTHIVIDAGRTQIAPNSRTVMSILGPADMVDDVTDLICTPSEKRRKLDLHCLLERHRRFCVTMLE
ncbi:peptidyl-tRNA hydrolase 2 [Carex littledalei]|uniref:peptidyl-tRNA hydrolase n=1 Tax=Carex littledalei TaxID=544730 RepID=A0A833RGB2_9POAL|nr:peptidyl-tRNA hydrolase 2 [Carex littledalei]